MAYVFSSLSHRYKVCNSTLQGSSQFGQSGKLGGNFPLFHPSQSLLGYAYLLRQDPPDSFTNMIHWAYRYAPDYPGLKGKDLRVKAPLLSGYPNFLEILNSISAINCNL